MIDLAELRRAAGLSQAQLAERLGVTQGRIAQIEGGANLRLSTLSAYTAALTEGGDGPMRDPAIADLFGKLRAIAELIGAAHRVADPKTYTGEVSVSLSVEKTDGTAEEHTYLSSAEAARRGLSPAEK